MDRLTSLGHAHDALSGGTERKPRRDLAQTRDDELTIGQMSRLYGVSLRTLRFYEDRGLMAPRREGGARYYRRGERVRMEMILRGKKLGFTLPEIADLIGSLGENDAPDLEDRLEPRQPDRPPRAAARRDRDGDRATEGDDPAPCGGGVTRRRSAPG